MKGFFRPLRLLNMLSVAWLAHIGTSSASIVHAECTVCYGDVCTAVKGGLTGNQGCITNDSPPGCYVNGPTCTS